MESESFSLCVEWNTNLLPQLCMDLGTPISLELPFIVPLSPWLQIIKHIYFGFSYCSNTSSFFILFKHCLRKDDGQATFLCLVRTQLKDETYSASPSDKPNPNRPEPSSHFEYRHSIWCFIKSCLFMGIILHFSSSQLEDLFYKNKLLGFCSSVSFDIWLWCICDSNRRFKITKLYLLKDTKENIILLVQNLESQESS